MNELEEQVSHLVLECAELFHESYDQQPGQKALDTWQVSNEPTYTAKRIIELVRKHDDD